MGYTVAKSVSLSDLEGTSASTISVSIGSKTFTTNTGKSWVVGQTVQLLAVGTKLNTSMNGAITAYNPATGSMTVNVTAIGAIGVTTGAVISMTDRFAKQAMSATTITPAATAGPFTTRAGLGLVVSDPIRAVNRTTQTTFVDGLVSAYNNATGSLSINTATFSGSSTSDWIFVSSGTISNWAITLADGDTVTVQSGATLTLDKTNTGIIGNISCPNLGTIQPVNASTTTPIFIRLSSRSSRITATALGSFVGRGAPITLTTGTGAQLTYTFPSPTWDPMVMPTYVEVETGNSTNVFERWAVYGSQFYGMNRYGYVFGADIRDAPTAIVIANGGGSTGIGTLGTLTAGTGYTNGLYLNVALTNVSGPGSGATANILIAGGIVTAVEIVNAGNGFTTSSVITCPAASVGGTVTTAWQYTITAVGVRTGVYKVTGGTGTNGQIHINAVAASGAITLAGVATIGAVTGGTLYTNGTYTNVPLTASNGTGAASCKATIVVAGGAVTTVTITNKGNGYVASGTLSCANTFIGNTGSGWSVPLSTTSGTLTQGSGYVNGTYTNVPVNGGTNAFGAKLNVTVAGGVVVAVSPAAPGNGYATSNSLTCSNTLLGGSGSGFAITVGELCNVATGAYWSGYYAVPTTYALNDVVTCVSGDSIQPQFQIIEIGDFCGPTLQTNIQTAIIATGGSLSGYYLNYVSYTCTGGSGTGATFVLTAAGTGTLNTSPGFFTSGTGYAVGDLLTVGSGGMVLLVTEVNATGAVGAHNKVCVWDPANRALRFGDGALYGAAVPAGARVRTCNIYVDALPTEAPIIAAMTDGTNLATFESAYAINDIATGVLHIDSETLNSTTKTTNTLTLTYATGLGRTIRGSAHSSHAIGAVAITPLNGRATGNTRAQFSTSPGGNIDCEYVMFGPGFYINGTGTRNIRLVNCGWIGQLVTTATTGPVTIAQCSQAANPYDVDNNYWLATNVQNTLSVDGWTFAQVQYISGTASVNLLTPTTCPNITSFKNINVVIAKTTRGDWRTVAPSACTFADDTTSIFQDSNCIGGFVFWQSTSNTRIANIGLASGTSKTIPLSNAGAAFNYTTASYTGLLLNNSIDVIAHDINQVAGAQPVRGDLIQVDAGCANAIVHTVNNCANWAGIPLTNRVISPLQFGLIAANINQTGGSRSTAAFLVNNTQTADTLQNIRVGLTPQQSIIRLGTITPGSGYTDGTYAVVALTGGTGRGATANIIVSGGSVVAVAISSTGAGFGYTVGDVLTGTIAGGSGWSVVVDIVGYPIGSGTGTGHGSLDVLDYIAGISPYWTTGANFTPNLPDASWFANHVGFGLSPTTGSLSIGAGGPNNNKTQYVITMAGVTAILSLTLLSGGTGYTGTTYYDVPLQGGTGTGASANIVISAGVAAATLVRGGNGYTDGDTLTINASDVGGSVTTAASWTVTVGSANSYTDNGGRMYAGGAGDTIEFTNWFPMRGITGFRNLSPSIYAATSTTSALGAGWINFKVLSPGSGYTTSNIFLNVSGGSGTGGQFFQTSNTSGAITGGYFMGVGYQVGDVITILGAGGGTALIQITAVPTLDFRLVPWGQDITSVAYATLSAANLQSAFAAMTGYDRNAGLQFQWRVTPTVGDVTRFLNFINIYTTVDPAFDPPIGYVPVGASNAIAGSVLGVVYAGNLQGSGSISGSGTLTVQTPYNFDGTTGNATVRVRKLGYLSSDTATTFQKLGSTVRVTQIADTFATVTNSATISAYTTIDTLSQLYDYIAYFGTTSQGLLYSPLCSASGNTLSLTSNIVIDGTASSVFSYNSGTNTITVKSAGLAAGTVLTAMSTSGTVSTVNGGNILVSYISSGVTKVLLQTSGHVANSRVFVRNVTAGSTVFDEILPGSDSRLLTYSGTPQTLSWYATYVTTTSAKLSVGGTVILGANGASILISQQDDTVYNSNAVNGFAESRVNFDDGNVDILVSAPSDRIPWKNIYAAYVAHTYAVSGIESFIGQVFAQDSVNYQFSAAIVVNNVGGGNVIVGGDGYGFRTDGLSLLGAGNVQIDNGKAYAVSTSGTLTPETIADGLLNRNLAGGTNGGRTVRDALRPARNKVAISGSALTVFAEDDTTVAWTAAITTAARDALQSVDPA